MRPRLITFAASAAVTAVMASGLGAASAQAARTCTWGGTPAEPTGVVRYTGAGLTNIPSSEPLPFIATGPLGGECSGTFTYRGNSAAGSTCAAGPFEARATGIRGVTRAAGSALVGLVPALLYDKGGDVVGSENPQVLTSGTEEQNFGFLNCNEGGFKEGNFSSVIALAG